MKKGFALLETMIVIAFLAVSLLLLYNTFAGMVSNSKKNYLYDDAANIYKTYYVKEYLLQNNLTSFFKEENIQELTCADFNEGCNKLINNLNIKKMYLTKYDLKEYDKSLYSADLNNYLGSLANDEDFLYRLVIEYNIDNSNFYASVGVDNHE